MVIIKCNEETCKHHVDGRCGAQWLEIQDQECMTYRYKDESVYEQEDE